MADAPSLEVAFGVAVAAESDLSVKLTATSLLLLLLLLHCFRWNTRLDH